MQIKITEGVKTPSATPFCTHLCNYNPGTNQIPPPYWTGIIADRALISPCNGTLSITPCHIASLLGVCSNRMAKSGSRWHLGPPASPAEARTRRFNFISSEKVKANSAYEEQLRCRWLELLYPGKGPAHPTPSHRLSLSGSCARCTGGGAPVPGAQEEVFIMRATKRAKHASQCDLASRSTTPRQDGLWSRRGRKIRRQPLFPI